MSEKNEILKMPVGREMDALVAEKVMGWIWVEGILAFEQPSLISPKLYGEIKNRNSITLTNKRKKGGTYPKYSTDITSAWEVLKYLDWPFDIFYREDEFFCANIYSVNTKTWYRTDEEPTAPLAICRAALLAVLEKNGG